MFKKAKARSRAFQENHPLIFFAIVIGMPLTLIIHLAYLFLVSYRSESYYVDILVEAHGLLFDILFFSIILALYAKSQEKKQKIKRFEEELDDYRGWKETEASYRVAGIIRRLRQEGIEDIDFNRLNLAQCTKEVVEKAVKEKAHIISLAGADLKRTRLGNADFEHADLERTNFQEANLERATFNGANLKYAIFFDAKGLPKNNLHI